MRLFIAINFDEETKQNIIAVQRRLREWGRGNFSHPENLHLTLAFLGETAPERVPLIRSVMGQLTVPSLHLVFDHVGYFRRDGSDIWWIGLRPDQALLDLQKELHRRLTDAGFQLDNRRFSPHITLARQVVLGNEPDKNRLLGKPFATNTDTVSLMLSERIDGKLIYTEQYAVGPGRQG